MSSPFYITTPIYYVTDAPHIGHLYSTVAADIMARYQRLSGRETWFLTGTDEHGQKCEKKAKETGETPQALADRVVQRYLEAWKFFGISYDDFIRTTEKRHTKVVQEYIARLMKTGDVYLAEYEGWYCVPDETYWTESQLVEGKCPTCGRTVERLKEESYFFKMSAYVDRLLEHIRKNPGFIVPEGRRNEVVSFLEGGVKDISISRTSIQWGIPMPADSRVAKEHKVYVWFDALTNYISALGPLDGDPKFAKFWPEAVHVVGKDILRFHAVYWPTFLMALGVPVPKKIVAHGWITNSGQKMSKSLGNVIEPIALAKEIGIDGLRFFLFREFVFGLDGEYTKEVMYTRINADLANDYGNCVNRVCAMIQKYLGEGPLETKAALAEGSDLKSTVDTAVPQMHAEMASYNYHKALEQVWRMVGGVNRYIETNAPWALAKSQKDEDKQRLKTVLLHCLESLRVASLCLQPFIPGTAERALHYLGETEKSLSRAAWGKGPDPVRVTKGAPLVPRLETPKQNEAT